MRKLIVILRFISKNKYIYLLNFFGLTIGLTSTIIISILIIQEYNYDATVSNYHNTFRIVPNREGVPDPSTPKPLAAAVVNEIPEVVKSFRFYPWYGYLACRSDQKKLTEKNVIFTDSSFVDVLDLTMINTGRKTYSLDQNSVLISENAAQKYFSNQNPVGEFLTIGKDRQFEIIGVYKDFPKASNFRGDLVLDISIVHHLTQVYFPDEWEHNSEFSTFLLLGEQVNLNSVGEKIQQVYAKNQSESVPEITLQALGDIHTNMNLPWESTPQIQVRYLHFLLIIVAMVFLMSLANFIILYISTSVKRKTSALVRIVYGARRTNLLKDFITEIWLILSLSIVLSLLIFAISDSLLSGSAIVLPDFESIFTATTFKFLVLLIVVLFSCGMIPAYFLVKSIPSKSLQEIVPSRNQRSGFMNYLIIIQFGFCVFLIIANLIIQKQLVYLISSDPGFTRQELITIPLNMHIGDGIYNERLDGFCEEIRRHPGIKNVTLGFSSPASVLTSTDEAEWEGKSGNQDVLFCWNSVYYDYFETLGINVVQGRSFNRNFRYDFDWDKSLSNFILNETAVKKMGLDNPIGKTFEQYGFRGKIVGIVEDFHFRSLHEKIKPVVFNMNMIYFNDIIIRMNPRDSSAFTHIEKVWQKFVPDKSLEMHFVTDQLDNNYKAEQNLANVLNSFFIVSLLIAIIGLITLTISTTQQRTKEIGIRKVNGASVGQILLMLNRDYLKWVLLGFVLICPIAWMGMNNWLSSFAYKTDIDFWIFIKVGLAVIVVAVTTVTIQSLSAVMQNPVDTLRHE